ncbi:radical SAM protein [Candidatus Poribacteria bacterium]|nr:radical SAM protein [Candidatus Poribacteria bacterium]
MAEAAGSPTRRIVVALVHPSNYDHSDPGGAGSFVQTYHKGVIPSNSLRLMQSLTEEALRGPAFEGLETEVHAFEDSIRGQQRAYRRLLARFPRPGTLLVVGMVAVQSNQFPRACDLMEGARARGAVAVIGGPHITASINAALHGISAMDPMRPGVPCLHKMPTEIERLIAENRAIVFHGDAEGAWAGVLRDILSGTAKPYYEAGLAPEMGDPGCVYSPEQIEAYVSPVAAVDTERGCPFKCKFCAAIQAHGRTVRCRAPEQVVDWIRRQCEAYGKRITILFASDNLARNPHWRELLRQLQALREAGHRFSIWAEADVLCNSGPNKGFLEEYAKAGGQGLFLGIESMNPDNIRDAGKKQNDVGQLPAFFAECRRHGIAPEGGYIIGFANDTPESIASDVRRLAEAGLARAWFFIKTYLPGSQDWAEAMAARKELSADLNDYDTTVVTAPHERMTAIQWRETYDAAYRAFYSSRSMVRVLTCYEDSVQRWRLIKGFLWCRWAYFAERSHPMIAGLYRHRPFAERRPGQPALPLAKYLACEAWRHLRYAGLFLREFYLFQHVIVESEWQLRYAERYARYQGDVRGAWDWLQRTFRAPMTRRWLNDFWLRYGGQKWRLLSPLSARWHARMVPHAMSEVVYTLRFSLLFVRGLIWER